MIERPVAISDWSVALAPGWKTGSEQTSLLPETLRARL